MRSSRLIPAVLALSGLPACSEEDSGLVGEQGWVGEHLEVWATPEATICADSFERLDAHAEAVSQWATEHGVEPNARRWRYYWLGKETFDTRAHCGDGAAACWLGGSIQAPHMVEHESVHAELPPMADLFSEGLAGLLGGFVGGYVDVSSPKAPVDVRAILDRGIDHSEYSGAEGFARLLLDRYPEQAVPAMAATAGVRGYENVRDVMLQYGVDLDDAVEDYSGQCSNTGLRFPLLECAEQPTAWQTNDLWQASGTLSCSFGDSAGPTGNGITTVRSFDIAEDGYYTITPSGLNGFLGGCGLEACAPLQPEGPLGDIGGLIISNETLVELNAGRYWIRIFASEDDPDPSWTLRIEKGDTTPLACPRACTDDRDSCVDSGNDPFECDDVLSECLTTCP